MKTKIDFSINRELQYDAIAETEKTFGKHYSEFSEEENKMMFAHSFFANEAKKQKLKSLGDTHFGMSWDEFINIIESYGFEVGLKYDFEHDNGKYIDEAVIYYHKDKGLIIWAESYFNKTSVNSGKLHGEIKYKNGITFEQHKDEINNALLKCSHDALIEASKEGASIDYDIREGLINTIERINTLFDYNSVWHKDTFLWFLDFTESKGEYDYKEITRNKILKSHEDVQKILKTKLI